MAPFYRLVRSLHRDDAGDASDGLSQGFLDADSERGELCGAAAAAALKLHPHRSVVVYADEFDVAAVGDQAGSQAIELGFDGLPKGISGVQVHGGWIGHSEHCVECLRGPH